MAKIRVYELARELNMTNRVLLEKLREFNFDIKSHMSSLEDDTVAEIKAKLHGPKDENVEVIRVKPTVIRKRRKAAKAEPPQPEAEPSIAETPQPPAEKAPEEAAEPETPAETREAPAPEETAEPEIAAETDAAAETAAETEKVEETDAAAPADDLQKADSEPAAERPAIEADQAPAETGAAPEAPPTTAAPTEPQPAEKPVKEKPSKKKKGKKETPAKIIKLPAGPPQAEKEPVSPPVEKEPEAAEAQKPVKETFIKVEIPEFPVEPETAEKSEETEKDKKKGGKKKAAEPAKDKKFSKKKISFRRKEVVEGEELYAGEKTGGKKGRKSAKAKAAKSQKPTITVPKAIKRRIKIDDTIVLSDLAKRMGIKAGDMIKKLMALGVMATVNQTIDFDTASLVASEFEYEVEKATFAEEAILGSETQDDPEKMLERPPVVTIMGHVDHGKTSLLDVIRKTRVTEIEAGGITQHIGAYQVDTDSGRIVFLDTPGHEAFTSMRARGAQATDIVVLVVAADDGVQPQTIEAINHSKAAGVPIIVAVNKIDKANADVDKVLRQLAELGLVPEDWGGDTIFVKVSAKKNVGISDLLEMILIQSEVLELKANAEKFARGHVIEAKLDAGRGPVATVLVLEGTLHTGDAMVCGIQYGKVRAMLNDRGLPVQTAGPSMPVEVLGLSGVPIAGDELVAVADDKSAKQVSQHRMQKQRFLELAKSNRVSLDGLFEKMKEGEVKDLNLILKADVHGSIEALKESLTKLSTEEVKINVIHSATGTITESDVSLAAVSDAIILGFNVRPSPKVHELANEEHVDMRFYDVIYNAIKDVKDAIVGLMSSTFEERILGRAEVRDVFHIPKVGAVAGCYVTDGRVERGKSVRVLRDGVVVYDGRIASLRRFKDDVKEVATGYECGIGIENFNDLKVGDVLEFYYLEEIKPELA